MRNNTLLFCALAALGASAFAATAPKHRITISKFELRAGADDLTRRRVVDRLTESINADGRAIVLDSEDVAALLLPLANIQQAPSLYAPATIPETGKLLAPNYVLIGSIDRGESLFSVLLELREIKTNFPVGTTSRQWRVGGPIPSFDGAVAELLSFIPRPLPVPPGRLTIEIVPPLANVRFLNEATPQPLPVERVALRPGRYAVAILPTDEAFEPMFEEITVRSGEHKKTRFELKRRQIAITLPQHPQLPAGAALFLDSQYVPPEERTRKVDAGVHELAIVSADGSMQVKTFEAGIGRPTMPSIETDLVALRQAAVEHLVHETVLESRVIAGAADEHDIAFISPDRVSMVDALTGTERWNRPASGWKAPAALLEHVLVVAGSWLQETTSGGGRGGSPTTTITEHAEVVAYDRASREVGWREAFTRAEVIDSDGSRALLVANGRLRIAGNEPPRAIDLDLHRSSDELDLMSARLAGTGIVVTDDARTLLRAFSLSGQPMWRLPVPDGVARIDTRGEHLLLTTNGGRLLKVSPLKGNVLWELSHPRPIRFLKFDAQDVLLVDGAAGLDRVALADGSTASYTLPLGDLPIVTGCEITEQGRILLLIADHRIAVLNPASMRVEWHHDSPDRIVWIGTAKGIAAAATAAGRLIVLGLTERHRIVGWIESIDAAARLARVRTLAPEIADERLRAVTFADHRAKRGDGTPLDVRGRHPRRGGIIELPLADPDAFAPGQLLIRGGGVRVVDVPEDAVTWVDESLECHGACVVAGLRAGRHEVLVTRPGFQPFRTTVDVGEELLDVRPRLDRQTADTLLEVDTMPRGAMVYVGGRYAGDTRDEPVLWSRLALRQVSSLRVEKYGYVDETREFEMIDNRRSEHFLLRQAPPLVEIMAGYAGGEHAPILGWPEAAITSDGVVGEPLRRSDDSRSRAFLRVVGTATLRQVGFELGGETDAAGTIDAFGGVRYDFGRIPVAGHVSAGLRYFMYGGAKNSSPPSIPSGWGSQEDRDAPLERWSHPISNVFVSNEAPQAFDGVLTLRPQVHTFFRISGGLLRGQSFHGTALVPDPQSGHLIRDHTRSYSVEMKSGWHAAVEAQTPLSLLVPALRLHPRYVVYARYDVGGSDFTLFREQSQRFIAGFGIVFYQGWDW